MAMNEPYFQPWIGQRYGEGLDECRTLVLGEAHYEWEENQTLESQLTIECVQEQINGEWTKQFWTNIAVALLGYRPSFEEKRQFWDSVAFYNYIQESVGFGPRTRPTRSMWLKARQPFYSVLRQLKPQLVVVLGYGLWGWLPSDGKEGPSISGAPQKQTWIYSVGGSEECLAYGVRHPSAGFSGQTWSRYIATARESAQCLTTA
jgi:hypothetical protein